MNRVLIAHRVEIFTGKKRSFEEDVCNITKVPVLAENERHIVLNDASFTKLDLVKDKTFNCYSVLNHPSISVNVNDRFWSDGVQFTLYSDDRWSAAQIEAAIKREVEKKCGWMKGSINFSILKTPSKEPVDE